MYLRRLMTATRPSCCTYCLGRTRAESKLQNRDLWLCVFVSAAVFSCFGAYEPLAVLCAVPHRAYHFFFVVLSLFDATSCQHAAAEDDRMEGSRNELTKTAGKNIPTFVFAVRWRKRSLFSPERWKKRNEFRNGCKEVVVCSTASKFDVPPSRCRFRTR